MKKRIIPNKKTVHDAFAAALAAASVDVKSRGWKTAFLNLNADVFEEERAKKTTYAAMAKVLKSLKVGISAATIAKWWKARRKFAKPASKLEMPAPAPVPATVAAPAPAAPKPAAPEAQKPAANVSAKDAPAASVPMKTPARPKNPDTPWKNS